MKLGRILHRAGNLPLFDPGWYQERNFETPVGTPRSVLFRLVFALFLSFGLQLSCTEVAPAIGC
jgi:hypothetical protein